jgi:ribonuclease P/MRP protein subunit POP1
MFFNKCRASKINMVPDTNHKSTSTDTSPDSSTVPHLLEASIIDHAEILQPGAILSMIVHDPREVSVKGTVSSSKLVSLDKENEGLEDVVPNADEALSEVGNMLSSMWMHPGKHDIFLSDCRELWDSSQNINPPVAEEVLCTEKQRDRIKFFCLDSGNDQGQTTQEKDSFILPGCSPETCQKGNALSRVRSIFCPQICHTRCPACKSI